MEEKIKYENGHHPNSQAALIHFEGERASEAGRKGALAAAAVKREKRKMRETVNLVMSMPATQDMKEALKKIGVDDDEATLQTMVIAQQAFKAIHDGDTRAARLLAEISGEVGAGKGLDDVVADDISDLNVSTYPTVLIPDNGRDKPKEGFIKPQPGPQTTFLTTKADIAIYGGAAGGGKAQPLDEPVLTPFGFRPMGSLKVGSKVIGKSGHEATVIQVHPQGVMPIYKVKFIDGAETRCTGQHLWLAKEARKGTKHEHRDAYKIYDADTLYKLVGEGKNMLVPLCDPVHFTRGRSGGIIKPYTLGVLLGDGNLTIGMRFVSVDEEIVENVKADGYDVTLVPSAECPTYSIHDIPSWKYIKLHKLNTRAENKHIPAGYLYAPLEERISLIQGLMDTDGYADQRGHADFCTTSLQLAKDMQFLIRSIGGKATISTKHPVCTFPDGSKKVCRDAYIVYIRVKDNSILFRLNRKKERCYGNDYNGGICEPARRILSIEKCGEAECQCITIDEPDGLYVTNGFIVTHNSYALLLEGLRHKDVKGFNGVIFRKNNVQITAAGGLWETSHQIYDQVPDAIPKQSPHPHWDFQSGAHIDFEHLEREAELHNWQGTQICFMAFDELTHFSKKMFTYMFSRNRSICGIKPYIRATCNPDAESWVAELISWWIDQETGYAIQERSGVIRYMTVVNDEIVFGDTADELVEKYGIEDTSLIKSFTFIKSSLDDNQILLQNDPTYKASLMAMSEIDRARLLDGNWKIKASAGMFFRREQIPVEKIYPIAPPDIVRYVRAWDFACTEQTSDNDPDSTSSCLMGKRQNGEYVVLEVTDDKLSTSNVEALLKRKTLEDKARFGFKYSVRIPIDPGEAGKTVAQARVKLLSGVNINPVKVSGSKIDRANPFSAQWQVGNVGIVAGEWNEKFYKQLESFPDGKHDDMVDASSDAFDELANNSNFNLGGLV